MKKIVKVVIVILSSIVLTVGVIALRIYTYCNASPDVQADAAIVLGAAVWGTEVSPVLKERINHALDLYRAGKVKKLIFTGGRGNSGELTESAAAREYAISRGVSAADILIEEKSHTTYENILCAKEVADAQGLRKVLIVSDPLHMKRSVEMSRDVGFEAYPSPTPTTRFESVRSQAGLLAHETYYYIGYLLRRPFLKKVAHA
ncbi:MAG TPA: YdcF family protein [Pyrinomonadaceae bacterium]|nr:YdcF family protein [Pyrinomonadaceae bacterium]